MAISPDAAQQIILRNPHIIEPAPAKGKKGENAPGPMQPERISIGRLENFGIAGLPLAEGKQEVSIPPEALENSKLNVARQYQIMKKIYDTEPWRFRGYDEMVAFIIDFETKAAMAENTKNKDLSNLDDLRFCAQEYINNPDHMNIADVMSAWQVMAFEQGCGMEEELIGVPTPNVLASRVHTVGPMGSAELTPQNVPKRGFIDRIRGRRKTEGEIAGQVNSIARMNESVIRSAHVSYETRVKYTDIDPLTGRPIISLESTGTGARGRRLDPLQSAFLKEFFGGVARNGPDTLDPTRQENYLQLVQGIIDARIAYANAVHKTPEQVHLMPVVYDARTNSYIYTSTGYETPHFQYEVEAQRRIGVTYTRARTQEEIKILMNEIQSKTQADLLREIAEKQKEDEEGKLASLKITIQRNNEKLSQPLEPTPEELQRKQQLTQQKELLDSVKADLQPAEDILQEIKKATSVVRELRTGTAAIPPDVLLLIQEPQGGMPVPGSLADADNEITLRQGEYDYLNNQLAKADTAIGNLATASSSLGTTQAEVQRKIANDNLIQQYEQEKQRIKNRTNTLWKEIQIAQNIRKVMGDRIRPFESQIQKLNDNEGIVRSKREALKEVIRDRLANFNAKYPNDIAYNGGVINFSNPPTDFQIESAFPLIESASTALQEEINNLDKPADTTWKEYKTMVGETLIQVIDKRNDILARADSNIKGTLDRQIEVGYQNYPPYYLALAKIVMGEDVTTSGRSEDFYRFTQLYRPEDVLRVLSRDFDRLVGLPPGTIGLDAYHQALKSIPAQALTIARGINVDMVNRLLQDSFEKAGRGMLGEVAPAWRNLYQQAKDTAPATVYTDPNSNAYTEDILTIAYGYKDAYELTAMLNNQLGPLRGTAPPPNMPIAEARAYAAEVMRRKRDRNLV